MAASTKVTFIDSNTFDGNIRDILEKEPFLIYKGSLDSIAAGAHVEHTFPIPAGYAVKSVVTRATTDAVDKVGVGTTTGTGVDIVAAVVPTIAFKNHTIASAVLLITDQTGYIHTMTTTNYDIALDYTIILQRVGY